MKLIHCADLHISKSEREYSLNVFKEILEIANREHADFLLICGDLFDSYNDAEALRIEVREYLSILHAECKVYFAPGNHEELQKKNRDIKVLPIIKTKNKPLLGGLS